MRWRVMASGVNSGRGGMGVICIRPNLDASKRRSDWCKQALRLGARVVTLRLSGGFGDCLAELASDTKCGVTYAGRMVNPRRGQYQIAEWSNDALPTG